MGLRKKGSGEATGELYPFGVSAVSVSPLGQLPVNGSLTRDIHQHLGSDAAL